MVKNILFVCKHNIFRSRVGEEFFKKFNKNKKYKASSAGIIKWNRKDLKNDKGFEAEKKVVKKFGIKIKVNSKPLISTVLKQTEIVVITADDVPASIFEDNSFNGKVIVWKIPDIKERDKNKEKITEEIIKLIEIKIKDFVRGLK